MGGDSTMFYFLKMVLFFTFFEGMSVHVMDNKENSEKLKLSNLYLFLAPESLQFQIFFHPSSSLCISWVRSVSI